MDPAYFHKKLSFREASLYIEGLDRRKRDTTFATVYLGNCIAAMLRAKGDCMPDWLRNDPLLEDDPDERHQPTKKEKAYVRSMVKSANDWMNQKKEP